ncbi:MAG: hypothetical protein AAFY98_04380 [Verrucomicrobiota bacterium]
MRPLLLLPGFLFLSLFAGCGEPQADLSTPKTHRSGAITFDYPKNWRVTEESAASEIHYLFVESPGDVLVILHSYPADGADDLTAFARDFSESAATETLIGKIERSKFTDMPDTAGYSWIVEGFEINLLGESFPHQRFYGTKEIGGRQIFLILQVATEDYSKVEAGFQLIRESLRSTQSAEQDGTDQPATAPESKPEGDLKPRPESEGRSE